VGGRSEPATSLGDVLAPISHAESTEKNFLLNPFTASAIRDIKAKIPALPLQISQ
jgi:hypothetical protein